MLSEEEMRRIEAEELAAARAVAEAEERARHRLAEHAYRREVRTALRPRPWWFAVRWLLPFVPVVAGVALLRPAPTPTDDTSGGIATSALMERCQDEVRRQLAREDLTFPDPGEAAGQFSADADGKRWNGWAQAGSGPRTDFSCAFTAADGSVEATLIQQEDTP